MEEASRFGIMNTREDTTIYEFEEKPKNPKSNLASMGVYIFTWKSCGNTCWPMTPTPLRKRILARTLSPRCWRQAKS